MFFPNCIIVITVIVFGCFIYLVKQRGGFEVTVLSSQVHRRARCLGKVKLALLVQAPVAASPWVAEAEAGSLGHLAPEETASLVL